MSKNSGLKLWERIILEMVWAMCWLVGHLPHFVLYYILAPSLRFIIYRLIGYRKRIVDENLLRCFPEKSEAERAKIRDGFYTTFAEIMVSTIALTNKKCFERSFPTISVESDDPDSALRLRELTQGKSWIALTSHFGLWEYLLVWTRFADQHIMAVYHKLRSNIFDELFKRLRSQHYKVVPVPAKESIRFLVKHGKSYEGESYVFGLIADQNPPYRPDSYWFSFMGQDTIFFEGGEKMALKTKMPVYYAYQRRISPGCYEFYFKPIWDGVEEVEPTEITRRYVAYLEGQIRDTPELWLWSHRRWKVNRENAEQKATWQGTRRES